MNITSNGSLTHDHFSTYETNLFKGIGILFIVLHNFFHNLTPLIGENEFSFKLQIFHNLLWTLQSQPQDVIRALFSYFGHYGVQIFIFFSSYGLTRKYIASPINLLEFMKGRLFKIYLSFLLCMTIYIALGLIKSFVFSHEKVLYWESLLWKLLLISNLIPGEGLRPVGPWWFIPFIFQFYLIYPFLLRQYRKFHNKFLVVISVTFLLVEWLLTPYLSSLEININYMPFGHLSVFCLGIMLAGQKKITLRYDYLMLAFLLFILGNFNAFLWETTDFTFTLLALTLTVQMLKHLQPGHFIAKCLIFFGGISFHLFMVNGFLRSPFHNFAETYNFWWLDNSIALASLIFSTLFAIALKSLDNNLRAIFSY